MNEHKETRQKALIELLERKPLFSQRAVCEEMVVNGFQVTQPSISRDMNELGVVKLSGRYLPPTTISEHLAENLTLSLQGAGPNLIVVRTKVGSANAVGVRIDDLEIEGVAGCIAGDDTIFIALADGKFQKPALKKLEKTLL